MFLFGKDAEFQDGRCAGRAMLAISCLATEQGSFRTLCPWPYLPPQHNRAAWHSLLGLHAELQGGGCAGRASAA
eukprot:scaffold24467_cov16-Tisochrysis_lutea.AAC.1